jgi:hypothetical protein
MSAPTPGIDAAEQPAADALLDVFKAIEPSEKRKHESVLAYWMSIRGHRELPPLRDLDPLEISDAAPASVLLELVGGGEDAEIRHLGESLKGGPEIDKIAEAPRPSVLASIARKLSVVAISRNFLAFEDEFACDGQAMRCWVTMLPFSSAGAWVDYIYAYVSFATVEASEAVAQPVQEAAQEPQPVVEDDAPAPAEDVLELDSPVDEPEQMVEAVHEDEQLPPAEPTEAPPAAKAAGFSFEAGAAGGFYAKAVKVKPTLPDVAPAKDKAAAPVREEPAPKEQAPHLEPEAAAPEDTATPAAEQKAHKSSSTSEGSLQSKLTEVRTRADEARMAKLRANAALYEGLSAAYDFALDAEDRPEEYLKLVEAQGLKIQLRAPMRPVVKLAFDGMCDDSTITQLEAVLAWAIEQELPRGSLAAKIEEAGGIGPILAAQAQAA